MIAFIERLERTNPVLVKCVEEAVQNGKYPSLLNALATHPAVEGWTALLLAVEFGNVEVTELLLKESADKINATNSKGESALHIACKHQTAEIAMLLLKAENIDMNACNRNNFTPLLTAIMHERRPIVELLVKVGNHNADFRQQYPTALRLAKRFNDPHIIDLLEKSLKNNPVETTWTIAYTPNRTKWSIAKRRTKYPVMNHDGIGPSVNSDLF